MGSCKRVSGVSRTSRYFSDTGVWWIGAWNVHLNVLQCLRKTSRSHSTNIRILLQISPETFLIWAWVRLLLIAPVCFLYLPRSPALTAGDASSILCKFQRCEQKPLPVTFKYKCYPISRSSKLVPKPSLYGHGCVCF